MQNNDQPPSASGERDTAEAFAFASTNEPLGLLRHWWRKGYDAGRATPSPGIDAADQKPIQLQHLAVADEDGLRWMSGRKRPDGVDHIELYAMPGYGRAPVLYAAPPAAQPSPDDKDFPFYELRFIMRVLSHQGSAPKEDWQTAYGMARDIFVRWAKDRAAEPHPPSRACMCDACKPSFENGADDPAQRYDIVRQVPGPSAEWPAEAEKLVDAYANEFAQGGATYARDIRRAALLAHLRTKP